MIPKANQRAGGQQLATHLLNEFDNDAVEVADLRGAIANNLHGAFAEWRAVAKATQCSKYLYSLSVNPDPQQRSVTREEYFQYINRVEKELKLGNQPRAVVFHVKYGREHCHVVWSRIDGEQLKAVQLSHDHQKLRTLTRDFAKEHGLTLPPGMEEDKGKSRFDQRKDLENLAEKQQEERTGINKAERLEAITAAWNESKDAETFSEKLAERGYFLARGDKRAYVVVDLFGEIHSLTRQVRGVKAAAVKARVAAYDIHELPDAVKAQEFARARLASQRSETPAAPENTEARHRAELKRRQAERRSALDVRFKALTEQHRVEKTALGDAQESILKGLFTARLRAQPKGVIGFIARITGIKLLVAYKQKRQDRALSAEHASQTEALKRRHEREVKDFSHLYRGLESLEKREKRSLEIALRREAFRAIAAPNAPVKQRSNKKPAPQLLTPAQRANLEEARQAGLEITRPASSSAESKIAAPFNEVTKKKAGDGSAAKDANEAERNSHGNNAQRKPGPDRDRER